MYFRTFLLKDFGKFHNRELDLKPGVNVLYGSRNSGKSTAADFGYAMLYGTGDVSGSEKAALSQRKPSDGRGFSGKAYLDRDGKTYLVEQGFRMHNRTAQVLNAQTGRETRLVYKNSLYRTMTDIDRRRYDDAYYIRQAQTDAQQAEKLNAFAVNLAVTGASNLDKRLALSALREQKNALDVTEEEQRISQLREELEQYEGDEEALAEVQKKIAENDEELAVETARRKREARRLISAETETTADADKDSADDNSESAGESGIFLDADLLKEYEPKKKLTDRWWAIALAAILVVAVIAALVYILPFDDGVRQLFIVCTILFVIMTIVDGLHAKGALNGENQPPSEEEFKRIVYELERKNEAYEDAEIDMSFARKFLDIREDLRASEAEILERRKQKEQLTEELRICEASKQATEREIYAVTLAMNTIQQYSGEYIDEWNYIINDQMADIMDRVTGGLYEDARIDERLRLSVKKNGAYMDITQIPAEDFPVVRLAIRLGITRRLCAEKLPVLIDGLPHMNDRQTEGFFGILETIPTDQILVFTDDRQMVSKITENNKNNARIALTNLD